MPIIRWVRISAISVVSLAGLLLGSEGSLEGAVAKPSLAPANASGLCPPIPTQTISSSVGELRRGLSVVNATRGGDCSVEVSLAPSMESPLAADAGAVCEVSVRAESLPHGVELEVFPSEGCEGVAIATKVNVSANG